MSSEDEVKAPYAEADDDSEEQDESAIDTTNEVGYFQIGGKRRRGRLLAGKL